MREAPDAVVIKPQLVETQTTVKADASPKTGDTAPIILIVCLLFISLAGIITVKWKGVNI